MVTWFGKRRERTAQTDHQNEHRNVNSIFHSGKKTAFVLTDVDLRYENILQNAVYQMNAIDTSCKLPGTFVRIPYYTSFGTLRQTVDRSTRTIWYVSTSLHSESLFS